MLERQVFENPSLRSRLLSAVLRRTLKRALTRQNYDPQKSRERLERGIPERKTARRVQVEEVRHPEIKGEWEVPETIESPVCILYLHGGGYMMGSPRQYRGVTSRLAQLAGARLFSLDYRLAPEHPFPAPVEDALTAYRWLLAQGYAPEQLVLAGDSAGGGLALALIHALKKADEALPAAAFVFSPYADLLATGDSVWENNERCAMFNGKSIPQAAAIYLQGQDACSPLASPLYGDFDGFPPLWIHVSDMEIVRDDGIRIAEKADRAGVDVHLRIWKDQPHAWPAFYPLLPEADRCLRDVATAISQLASKHKSLAD
ncbi:alpha/beta hydrolase [Proteobacteria bacterium 005FR1]|nr:alpha/beta hydrolase [Proteobacteria bacterium 005FR1]